MFWVLSEKVERGNIMAVKGAQSKKIVEDKLLAMFPGSFVADKKIYINFEEDN